MDTKNIMVAFREVRKIWTHGLMYNISTDGKKITIKEKSMNKRLTVNDAMAAIATLTTVVNNLVITVNNLAIEMRAGFEKVNADISDIKKDIVRLDKKIDNLEAKVDNIVILNNLKTK